MIKSSKFYKTCIPRLNNMSLIQYTSLLDNRFNIIIITKKNKMYDEYNSLFLEYGIAVCNLDTKDIIIDGEKLKELSDQHLYAIEAHEIGHDLIRHLNYNHIVDEQYADYVAMQILNYNELFEASKLIRLRFIENYAFGSNELNIHAEVKDIINNYLNKEEN